MKATIRKISTYVTTTHFDKAMDHLDQRFAETHKTMDKKFDTMQKYIDIKVNPLEKELEVNRDFREQVLKTLDWLVGAFKKFDEEHTLLSGKYSGIQDRIDDHEERLVHIERTKIFQ
jgi:DNA-binding ferritin-like protein